ncbi:MAG: hypothetical protein K0B16_00495, partial [Burkholderiaceae bacterium]|nr:hypothetical protein [Burkholderiaceae bacterium]
MSDAVSVIVDATLITLVLALAAFGLAIVFGMVGVINMGHGAMLTLGAYLMWATTRMGVPFVIAALLAAVGTGVIGMLLEHLVIRHFYDEPLETLLLTWGFFLISTEVIKIVFGTDLREVVNPLPGSFEIGAVRFPVYRSLVALFTVFLLVASALVFYRTRIGIRIRALMQNAEVANLLGLNIQLTYKLVFVAGSFMAGLAGALISPLLSVDPYIGNIFLVRSFFAVTVGGVGQILGGTLAGSFLVGGMETVFALVSSQVVAQT